MTRVEHDMVNVFESIGVAESAQMMQEILSYLKVHKELPQQRLWQMCSRTMSQTAFKDACEAAWRAGYIQIYNSGGQMTYRITSEAPK